MKNGIIGLLAGLILGVFGMATTIVFVFNWMDEELAINYLKRIRS